METNAETKASVEKRPSISFKRKLQKIFDIRCFPNDFGRILGAVLYRISSFPRFVKFGKQSPGIHIQGSGILITNHTGWGDAPTLIFSFYSRRIGVLTYKKVMDYSRITGLGLRLLGCISIDKDTVDYGAIRECKRRLKDGDLIAIFPEGSINREQTEMFPFKEGAALLAAACRVPVYPVYCSGHYRPFRRMLYVIGEPIDLSEQYSGQLDAGKLEYLNGILRARMEELQQECFRIQTKKKKTKREIHHE